MAEVTLAELAFKVRQMRAAQKQWFAGDKSSATLDRSKKLEREVDRLVAVVLDGQGRLFK